MLHRVTKIGFAMQKKLSAFILPQTVQYARDRILYEFPSSNGYENLTDKQIENLVKKFQRIIDFYNELPIEITYKIYPDKEELINEGNTYEYIIIKIKYKEKSRKKHD